MFVPLIRGSLDYARDDSAFLYCHSERSEESPGKVICLYRHFDQTNCVEKSPKAKQYHFFFAKHPSLSHFTPLLSRMRERRRRLSLQKKKHLRLQVFFGVRQRHILPGRVQPSTFCAARLNDCVRYENRWDPRAITTGVAPPARFELATTRLTAAGSTVELRRNIGDIHYSTFTTA